MLLMKIELCDLKLWIIGWLVDGFVVVLLLRNVMFGIECSVFVKDVMFFFLINCLGIIVIECGVLSSGVVNLYDGECFICMFDSVDDCMVIVGSVVGMLVVGVEVGVVLVEVSSGVRNME